MPGLRDAKKREMRQAISDVATSLFLERGYDHVTVAEVAEAARVSKMTVYNHFPTKEDLVFDRRAEFEDGYSRVIRGRPAGESVIGALRRRFLASLKKKDLYAGLHPGAARFWRMVQASPSLRARELEISLGMEASLARTFAKEMGLLPGDIVPRAMAAQVIAVQRLLQAEIQLRLLKGESIEAVGQELTAAAGRAFDSLERGIGLEDRR